MLLATGLTKRFGDVQALDGVDLAVAPGEIVGFLGPNGAGKTTTMRAIMRLIELDAGDVTWHGAPVTDRSASASDTCPPSEGCTRACGCASISSTTGGLSGMRVRRCRGAADTWLERLGLPTAATSDVQDLSSGNQQRVQLALALLTDPELLVLDEPFSGLDPVAVDTFGDILREQVEPAPRCCSAAISSISSPTCARRS